MAGQAVAQLLARLVARHDVAVLYLRAADEPPLDPSRRERCAFAQEILRPGSGRLPAQRWAWRGRYLSSLLRGRPVWAAKLAVPAFAARARRFVREWQPDLVQLEFHVMGQYLSALAASPAPRVLVQHEPGAAAARDQLHANCDC